MAFINHTKKFVFIANARCACTSMYKQLEKESEGDSIEWEGGLRAYPPQYHMSAKNVVKEFPETEKYFKFAFVRNPWSRFLSLFNQFYPHSAISNYDEWATEFLKYHSFKDLCVDFKNSSLSSQIHFLPLSDQLSLTNNKVDFIGKFENLLNDYSILSKTLNFKNNLEFHENNKSHLRNNKTYREFYEKESIEAIGDFYKNDLKSFDYKF